MKEGSHKPVVANTRNLQYLHCLHITRSSTASQLSGPVPAPNSNTKRL